MEISGKKKVPETVALVAMGSSRMNWDSEAMKAGGPHGVVDEVWVINKLAMVYQHDIVFRMDDLRKPRQCNLKPGTNRDRNVTIHDNQTEWFMKHNKPIITSTAYPEFPTSVAYPLEDVINTLGYSYFITTPAYAAAFAIHIGVKHLKLYGCDYVYTNNILLGETGRANMEFILALGMTMGMKVEVAKMSTLLETNRDLADHMYGYEDIIEVVESKDPNKRYELKVRKDLTEERNNKIKAIEKKQLQELLLKHGEEVKRDLIRGGEITHDDIDQYSKQQEEQSLLEAPIRADQDKNDSLKGE